MRPEFARDINNSRNMLIFTLVVGAGVIAISLHYYHSIVFSVFGLFFIGIGAFAAWYGPRQVRRAMWVLQNTRPTTMHAVFRVETYFAGKTRSVVAYADLHSPGDGTAARIVETISFGNALPEFISMSEQYPTGMEVAVYHEPAGDFFFPMVVVVTPARAYYGTRQ